MHVHKLYIIQKPTRHRINQNSNLLDLVLSEQEEDIDEIKIQDPIGKSDHNVISFRYIINADFDNTKVEKFNYNKANYEEMKEDLDINWGEELRGK